jgi:anti-sigma factor RsiW
MTDCHETREALEEYRRGELAADAVRAVEAHLVQCAPCRRLHEGDDALAAMIRSLPRTPAPQDLRRRIQGADSRRRGPRAWLARPWVAAAVAAAVVAVTLSPWVRFRSDRPDAVETLVASGVTEHKRILLQLQGFGGEVADPAAAFAVVRSLTDIQLPPVLAGDKDFRLVAARPTVIADRKAAAAVLSYKARSVTTYFALPGKDLPMPSERRVQIEQYRPYMRQVNGFHVIYWKQGELAYLMVTDLDDHRTRQVFLKMRKAM